MRDRVFVCSKTHERDALEPLHTQFWRCKVCRMCRGVGVGEFYHYDDLKFSSSLTSDILSHRSPHSIASPGMISRFRSVHHITRASRYADSHGVRVG